MFSIKISRVKWIRKKNFVSYHITVLGNWINVSRGQRVQDKYSARDSLIVAQYICTVYSTV